MPKSSKLSPELFNSLEKLVKDAQFKLDLIVITENVGFEIKTITASKITRVRNRFNRFGTSKLYSLSLFKFFLLNAKKTLNLSGHIIKVQVSLAQNNILGHKRRSSFHRNIY